MARTVPTEHLVPDDIDSEYVRPSQWQDMRSASIRQRPEERLYIAILEDAVAKAVAKERDFTCDARTMNLKMQAEATLWLLDPDHGATVSMETCCHVLHIEPEFIRRGIRAWRISRGLSTSLTDLEEMSGSTLRKRSVRHIAQTSRRSSIRFASRS